MARLLCIGGGFRHRVVAGPKGPWPGLAGLRRGLCAPAVLAMLGERGCGKAEGFRFRNLWTPDAIAALFGALLDPRSWAQVVCRADAFRRGPLNRSDRVVPATPDVARMRQSCWTAQPHLAWSPQDRLVSDFVSEKPVGGGRSVTFCNV